MAYVYALVKGSKKQVRKERERNGGWFHSGFIQDTIHSIINPSSWHLPPSFSPSQLKAWLTSGLGTDCYLSIHPSSDRLPPSFSHSSRSQPAFAIDLSIAVCLCRLGALCLASLHRFFSRVLLRSLVPLLRFPPPIGAGRNLVHLQRSALSITRFHDRSIPISTLPPKNPEK